MNVYLLILPETLNTQEVNLNDYLYREPGWQGDEWGQMGCKGDFSRSHFLIKKRLAP